MSEMNLIILFLVVSCSADLTGSNFYRDLIAEWGFAYNVVSDVVIPYNDSQTESFLDGLSLTTDLYIPWTNLSSTVFLCPITGYPVALVYNIPRFNSTLRVDRLVLQQMISNNTFFWNDPLLLQYNPDLEAFGLPVRMIFDAANSPINQMLINYIFDNETDRNSSWKGLSAPKHLLVPDYLAVMSAVGVLGNSAAFVPLPYFRASTTTTTNLANIVVNGTDVNPLYPAKFSTSFNNSNVMTIQTLSDWPFNIFAYVDFDTASCNDPDYVTAFRFFYWSFNNTHLYGQTIQRGFYFFDQTSYGAMLDHLLHASCSGIQLLQYTNLSMNTRTPIVFGISTALMVIFIVMVILVWFMRKDKTKILVILNNILVIVGLVLTLASFVFWWFTPSNSTFCLARGWLLGLGYTNVIAAIYIYVYTMHSILSKERLSRNMIEARELVIAYCILEIFEIIILVVWTLVEKPTGIVAITNTIKWESMYTCTTTYGIVDLVEIIYFCVISIFGCFVIYKHWRKNAPEDTRWLLVALYNQILIFLLFMVITRTQPFPDDQLYIITVFVFVFAEANVVCSFFLPRFVFKLKSMIPTGKTSAEDLSGKAFPDMISMRNSGSQ